VQRRRRIGQRAADLRVQPGGGGDIGHFLPVDHAVDEIDRLAVGRQRHKMPRYMVVNPRCDMNSASKPIGARLAMI
jgi:hypothetical protein